MNLQTVSLLLLSCIFLFSCTNNSDIPLDDQGREDFHSFRQKFYTDSLFQLQRIEFPLLGANPDGSNAPFYWEIDNWKFKKNVDLESKEITMVPLLDMGDVMRERIIVQNRFMIESMFSLINNQWFLTQYSGIKDIGSFSSKKTEPKHK